STTTWPVVHPGRWLTPSAPCCAGHAEQAKREVPSLVASTPRLSQNAHPAVPRDASPIAGSRSMPDGAPAPDRPAALLTGRAACLLARHSRRLLVHPSHHLASICHDLGQR